ncbi:MAG: TerB N-terminal domain-containing protein [Eubacteriales bacterium]
MIEKESDKMFTFTLPGEPVLGELIPSREKIGGSEKANEVIDRPKHPEFDRKLYDPHSGKIKKPPSAPYYQSPTYQYSSRIENTILDLNRSPIKRNFYELALKYTDMTVEDAPEVSFMCYWPSYELMSQNQLDWYFCVRTKFRRYEYPKADLSYIFLYIYELINGIGIENAEDGLVRMIQIWNGYKNLHKKLSSYLPEWIIDYMDVYKCQSENIFNLLNDFELTPYISENYIITRTIHTDGILPIEIIAKLSDYAFYKSNFIAKKAQIPDGTEQESDEPDNEKLFLNGLPLVIKKTDQFMKSEGKGIFDTYTPEVIQSKGKIPFRSAVFEKNLRTNPITSDYMGFQPLRSFITLIIKHYENALRSLCNYRGKLKADMLPEGILKVIKNSAAEDFAQNRRKEVVLSVNKETLIRLIHESEMIKKMLLEPVYEAEAEISEPCAPDAAVEDTAYITDHSDHSDTGITEEKEYTVAENDGNEPENDALNLISSLTDIQREILNFLIKNGGRCDEKSLSGQFKNIFITTEADAINEKSLEVFNDLFIAYEDGYWYIIEDYLDEIKEYLE